MLVYLSNDALLSGVDKGAMLKIKKHLTIANPLFHKRVELGLTNWGVNADLFYYKEEKSDAIRVPIGELAPILNLLTSEGYTVKKSDILDARVSNQKPEFFKDIRFTGTLRDYQREVVDACLSKTIGCVEAMTGSGKTIIFIALTIERKEPTLILVHTIELANQTIDAFLKFTNLTRDQIGFIGAGKFHATPITIGLHQSLSRLDDFRFDILNNSIGQVISDETHICPARTFYRTMTKLKARYKFGFSATLKRDDGLTQVIHFASGPIIHKVETKKLKDVLITPEVVTIYTSYFFPLISSDEYAALLTDLSMDTDRNQLIIDTANNDYSNRNIVILCVRVAQVEYLKNALGDEAVMLHSKMSKKERKHVMEELKAGEKSIVVSTYGLFSTGIDIPRLDVLFMAAPIRSEVKVRQASGRLMRKADGKTKATIVNFIDEKIDLLKWQGIHRAKILKRITQND